MSKVSNEIDRLEIAVEAEANRANRALSGMEKRLNKIADSLEKVISLSSAINNTGKFDFSQFEKINKAFDDIADSKKNISKKTSSPKIDDSSIKKASKSLDDLYDKFQSAGKGIDVSGMNSTELENALKKAENEAKRFNDRLNKKISLEGTDKLGKSWESLVYDIQKATNQAETYREALDKIKSNQPDITINREKESATREPIENPKSNNSSVKTKEYNPEDIYKHMDNASKKVNTFSARINRLKKELSDLASSGYTEYDPEYDDVAKELAELTQAKKEYDKAMRDSVSPKGIKEVNKEIKQTDKLLNSTKRNISNFGKKISDTMKKATRGIAKVKKAIHGTKKQGNKGMSFGRMLGSSIAFSLVFQGISMIQRAIKEGSDNLVQYSSEYNNSISSMVSSLLYLKNAWAVAFAPITNVVAPYISAFIDMLASGLNAVGRFMSALTGKGFAVQAKKAWKDYGAGVKESEKGLKDAGKAAKELQSYTLGIDELNVIDPNNGSGGSGSGGGSGAGGSTVSPSDMFETVETKGAIASFGKRLREAFLSEDWVGLGKILADGVNSGLKHLYAVLSWDNVGGKITAFANAFTISFNSLVDNINWDLMGRTVGTGINSLTNTVKLFVEGIDWKNFGKSFANGLMGLVKEVDWKNLGNTIGSWFMVAWKVFYGFVSNLDYEQIGYAVSNVLNGALKTIDLVMIVKALSKLAIGMLNGLRTVIRELNWKEMGQEIVNAIASIDWGGLATGLFSAGASLIKGLLEAFGELPLPVQIAAGAIGTFFAAFKVSTILSSVIGLIKGIAGAISLAGGLLPALKGIVSALGGPVTLAIMGAITIGGLLIANWDEVSAAAKKAWGFVKQKFQEFDNFLTNIFSIDWSENFGVIGDVMNVFVKNAENMWKAIKRVFGGINDFISGLFSKNWEKAWKGIRDIFGGTFEELIALAKAPINVIIGLVNGLTSGISKGLNGIFSGINDLLDKIPKEIAIIGGLHIPKISIPKIPYLANGGMLNSGQMFIAREKGPELVGTYGNKTAVMNNNQIVQSVSNGVRSAIEYSNGKVEYLLTQILEYQQMLLEKDNSTRIDGKKAGQLIDRARSNSGYSFRTV